MLDRRLVKNLDQGLLLSVLALLLIGLLAVFSATHAKQAEVNASPYAFLLRQSLAAALGLMAMAFALSFDYRYLEKLAKPLYLATLVLLALLLVLGHTAKGAQSWFRLGGLSFEPAEVAKVAIVLSLAKHLEKREDIDKWSGVISAFVHVGIPVALVLAQPDLGTALVFLGILFAMLYVAGAQPRHLFLILLTGAVLAVPAYFFVLKPYQQARIMMFLNPYADPTGNGYNVIQSMIAVGSGRLFGKGLFSGTQTQLNFVPEHHTDFIFSVIGEEFGFLGSALVLFLYYYLFRRGLAAVIEAKDRFGSLLAAGVVAMLFSHVLINVGMNLGVMPVTGIPLPFLSYGGSALIANLLGVGLLANVYMRRQKILF
ncbi:MAG TPA: rod shape-determining protein RodA [Firmicutes bacterium]|nr:rod shape-determining protein RodA [Bacillota bacterium]